jgi:hypothetical protein
MSKESTSQELKKGIQALENNIGYFPSDSCERTVLRVLRDTKVHWKSDNSKRMFYIIRR